MSIIQPPVDFPTDALAQAYTVVKAGHYDAQQRHDLTVCAWNLLGWAAVQTAPGKPLMGGTTPGEVNNISDAEAHAILVTSQQQPGMMAALPIPPAKILGLALWLLRIVLPIVL
jgi:hypothetical protein